MFGRALRALRRLFWPYHCPGCGRPYQKLRLSDLPPALAQEHRAAGTADYVEAYAYRCPSCHGDGEAVAIC